MVMDDYVFKCFWNSTTWPTTLKKINTRCGAFLWKFVLSDKTYSDFDEYKWNLGNILGWWWVFKAAILDNDVPFPFHCTRVTTCRDLTLRIETLQLAASMAVRWIAVGSRTAHERQTEHYFTSLEQVSAIPICRRPTPKWWTSHNNCSTRSLHPGPSLESPNYHSNEHSCTRRASAQTIRNRLREAGVWARRPYVGPVLQRQHRRLRVRWCTNVQGWNLRNWRRVWFSDESRFLLQRHDGRQRVYRRRNERFANNCVAEVDRFGGGSVMMWGAISYTGRSELVLVQGNLTAVGPTLSGWNSAPSHASHYGSTERTPSAGQCQAAYGTFNSGIPRGWEH